MIKAQPLSLFHAMPLSEEEGIGALSIPGYLREVTQRYAASEAVVMHYGKNSSDGAHTGDVLRWSYQDLWNESVRVAKALIANGVTKDTRVGILMTNRAEYLSAMFGAALAGGVSVVFSTFSTPDEMKHLLSVSDVSVLLFEDQVLKKDFAAMLTELEPAILSAKAGTMSSENFPFLKRLVYLDGVTKTGNAECDVFAIEAIESWDSFLQTAELISTEVVEARAAKVHPSDAGALFFSSGTTSLPKGILHSQQAFTIQYWRWKRLWRLDQPARSWTGNGFFWSGPVSIIVGTALSTGGAIILQPLFDADEALALIEKEKVSLMNGRPHQWARMQASPRWAQADLSSLRQITKGELIMEHPTVTSTWEMPNAFGTTETMSILSSFVLGDPANEDPRNFGALLPGNIMKIVDPLIGNIVPMGERGEVCIKGPTLMKGYLGKSPEETFDEDGYYRTGDGGYIDENGHLFWEGRLNDIIKTGGANVSPEEVDTVIGNYPGVKRSQTVGVPHETLSEMVVACIVPVDGATLDEEEMIAFLKQKLASFKVPRKVLFFAEDEFSLTGNEKVKASDIRQMATERLAAVTQ
ncbi:long-chain fatty acid--CoA ligase [Aestuariicella hydrocarbonica]|uniref:Long-chain fatty acid--CoA ligase n=1 Tax=Pseudomaricurvus hydrocarbonicus TaxID=1470433 RepID=A0A9E5JSF0_9GAMM|nr:long-chain fatty acid--CoA ligase [Aestuariicella hydrocarbonica]NHO65699.1 long-chain fatty acid--CoA ligase [Aestuariicella hydrocarbonica]